MHRRGFRRVSGGDDWKNVDHGTERYAVLKGSESRGYNIDPITTVPDSMAGRS